MSPPATVNVRIIPSVSNDFPQATAGGRAASRNRLSAKSTRHGTFVCSSERDDMVSDDRRSSSYRVYNECNVLAVPSRLEPAAIRYPQRSFGLPSTNERTAVSEATERRRQSNQLHSPSTSIERSSLYQLPSTTTSGSIDRPIYTATQR